MQAESLTKGQTLASGFIYSVFFAAALPSVSDNGNTMRTMVTVILATALNVLISLIAAALSRKSGDGGRAAGIVLLLILVFVSIVDLSSLTDLLNSTIFPDVPVLLISLSFVFVAAFCAHKGFAAAGKASLLIVCLIIIGELLMTATSVSFYSSDNFMLPFYDGNKGILQDVMSISARSFFFPQIFLCGKVKQTNIFVFSHLLAGVFCALLFLSATFALGSFGNTQLYQLYSLSGIGEIGAIRRLDIVFGTIYIIAGVFKLSFNFCCIYHVIAQKSGKNILLVSLAAFTAVVTAFLSEYLFLKKYVTHPYVIFSSLIIAVFVTYAFSAFSAKRRRSKT